MAKDQKTGGGSSRRDTAASSARRAAKRREASGSADVRPGGPGAPAEVTIPGQREARTPGHEASPDVDVPRPEPELEIPGRNRGEPDTEIAPPMHGAEEDRPAVVSGPSPEEAPELLGERSDYPLRFGEDPGDLGPERS
jgi:hypothetical protein